MKIKRMFANNFMSFRDIDLDIPDAATIIGVVGSYDGVYDVSNEAGKSTLVIDLPLYVLFGTGRKSDSELIHWGESNMLCGLVLSVDGKEHLLERGRDGKSLVLRVDGEKFNTKDYNEFIYDLIGVDREDFLLTSCFVQGDINSYMDLGPSDKLRILSKWEDISKWKTIAKEQVSPDVRVAKDESGAVAQRITLLDEKLGDKDLLVSEQTHITSLIEDTETKLQELEMGQESVSVLRDVEKRINYANRNLEDVQGKLEYRREKIKELSLIIATSKIAMEEAKATVKDYVGTEDVEELQQRLSDYERRLAATDNLTGMCPVLKESCDRIEPDEDVDELQDIIKTIRKRINKYNNRLGELESVVGIHTRSLDKNVNLLNALEDNTDYDDLIAQYESDIKELREEYDKVVAEYNTSYVENDLDGLIYDTRADLMKFQAQLGRIEHQLQECDDAMTKKRKLIKEQFGLDNRLKMLNYIYYSFNTAIPNMLLEYLTRDVEEEANLILNNLVDGLSVNYSFLKELKDKEKVCPICMIEYDGKLKCVSCGRDRAYRVKEELQLWAIEHGNYIEFDMLSGGAKTLVSLALRLANGRMLTRRGNGKVTGIALMDEVTAMLDETKRKNLFTFLQQELPRLGFDQIFLISHSPEIRDHIPYVINVDKKADGHSTAELL